MKHYQLPDQPERSSMQVPDDYFRQFQQDMEAKLMFAQKAQDTQKQQQNEPEARVSTWTQLKTYLYVAAMFVMLFVGLKGVLVLTGQDKPMIAQEVLETPDDMAIESDYTAEEYMLGSLNGSTMLYYLYEDAINTNN